MRPRFITEPVQVVQWLLSNAHQRDDGCIISHIRPNDKGYIHIEIAGRTVRASRLICKVTHGTADPEAMHLCNVKSCINPDHIKPGTRSQNIRYMWMTGQRSSRRV